MNKPTCRWPECERETRLKRGLCPRDYKRATVIGDFERPWDAWAERKELRRANKPTCRWPNCTRDARVKGLCFKDSRRAVTLDNFVDPWTIWEATKECELCGTGFKSVTLRARYCSKQCEAKAYVVRNEPIVKAYRRQYLADNPDVYRASAQRRRAQKRSTIVERFTADDVRMARGDTCYLCGGKINFRLKHPNPKSPSLDHVIALSRGGTHTLGNVAMTHLKCNLSKQSSLASVEPHATLFAS